MTSAVRPSSAPSWIFQYAHEVIEELPEILRPVAKVKSWGSRGLYTSRLGGPGF